MAGINFGDLKNRFSKAGNADQDAAGANVPEYEDDARDENEYDDSYTENGDSYSDDGQYDDADSYAQDDRYPEDEQYEDDGYVDEAEYEDGAPAYDDEEEGDPETLGYNPAIFQNLDGDEQQDAEPYDGDYDDEQNGEAPYDDASDGGFDDPEGNGAQERDRYEGESSGGFVRFIVENDWVMYLALVVLPPLGIWLLWRKNKFDITLRTTLSAASAIWLVVVLILLFTRSGSTDNTTPVTSNPNFVNYSSAPTLSASASATPTAAPTTEPTATARAAAPDTTSNTGADGNVTYVWATNAGVYYHTQEDCGGQINASKMTLETATTRGLNACPDCAGGTNPNADKTVNYYATSTGKYYHKDSSCSGMKNASIVTVSNAVADGKKACPVCIGYYGRSGGKYYHTVSNCSDMQNAITQTKAEWEAAGKTACPVCMGGSSSGGPGSSTPTQTMVWATTGGTYFHTKSGCSGMTGASYVSVAQAVSAKKTACPKCVSASTVNVFATQGGKYYHTKNNCSSMKNAQYVTAEQAIKLNKTACPECATMFATATNNTTGGTGETTGGTGAITGGIATGETSTYVYATTGGTYFHTDSTCSGMANAKRVTYAQAVSAKKSACPTCIVPSKLTVYATGAGKYYHTNATCTGMIGAVAVQASTALAYGKTACPTCAKALSANSTNATTPNNAYTNPIASPNQAASANTTVYIKLGASSNYYHVAAKCAAQGVSGANNVTLEYALNHAYVACPSCNPPSKIYQ